MCQILSPITHIRIMRCPHDTNYVTLGCMTLHLNDADLVMLDQAIHKLAQREPGLQKMLYQALCANNAPAGEETL